MNAYIYIISAAIMILYFEHIDISEILISPLLGKFQWPVLQLS